MGRGLWVLLILSACDEGVSALDPAQQVAIDADSSLDASLVDGAAPDAEGADAAPDGFLADAAQDAAPLDASPPDVEPADLGPPPSVSDCLRPVVEADYARFDPVLGHHCGGTNHQDIEAVDRLVFLGDSITYGTPPARTTEFYRTLLETRIRARFGETLQVKSCAHLGARARDLMRGEREVAECFADVIDLRTTLVVITVGGNDLAAWGRQMLAPEQAMGRAIDAADDLEAAVAWLKDPTRFPFGMHVVFANPYEYTDGTGDLDACPLAAAASLGGNWLSLQPAVTYLQERFLEIAVDYGADMVFAAEAFCGHGFHHDDPRAPCYRGPEAENWFDLTCIHPNVAGHAAFADLFSATIAE